MLSWSQWQQFLEIHRMYKKKQYNKFFLWYVHVFMVCMYILVNDTQHQISFWSIFLIGNERKLRRRHKGIDCNSYLIIKAVIELKTSKSLQNPFYCGQIKFIISTLNILNVQFCGNSCVSGCRKNNHTIWYVLHIQ